MEDPVSDHELPRGLIVGTVEVTGCDGSNGEFEWQLSNPEPLAPLEQPQPVWFYPFGRPIDAVDSETEPTADVGHSDHVPSATRFAPVIASNSSLPFTAYHSKYLAYELTKQVGADQGDKLSQSLSNATVAMNPHRVDAAALRVRSPLSRGAILADEVGLGKTIEAGIIVSQLWAEKKRRILVLVPASLRKQWSRELAQKFFLPSMIMESKSYQGSLVSRRRRSSNRTKSSFVRISSLVPRRRTIRRCSVGLGRHRRSPSAAQRLQEDNKIARDALRVRSAPVPRFCSPPHRSRTR